MRCVRGKRVVLLTGGLALLAACGVPTPGTGKNANQKPPSLVATYQALGQSLRGKSTAPDNGVMAAYLRGVDDHARLVFVSTQQNQTQICTIRPEGTDFKVLTTGEGYKCRPAWSLDHKKIAFFQYAADPAAGDKVDILVMDADGGNQKTVLAGKNIDGKTSRIGWKPDATVLYVQEKNSLGTLSGYEVATGRLADTVRVPPASFIKEIRALSPDTERIAGVGLDPKSGYMHIGNVKRSGGKDMDFMHFFPQQASLHLGAVAWSYDNSLLAFEVDAAVVVVSTSYALLAKFQIYTLSPQEMDCEYTSPAFSPQGQYVVCVVEKGKEGNMGSGDREIKSDLWIMNIDGSKPRQLTTSGSNFDPHW